MPGLRHMAGRISITWCDLFRPNFGEKKKSQKLCLCKTSWDPWKQALLGITWCDNPRGPKSWKNSRSPSGIEIFKRDWNEWHFQARLKISSEPPTKPLFLWAILKAGIEKFQARLKFSSENENFKRKLEIFKRSSEIDFFQDSGPLGFPTILRLEFAEEFSH